MPKGIPKNGKKAKTTPESIESMVARAQFADAAELAAIYKRLAKQADQRLVRLQQLAEKGPDYKDVTMYAYRRAMIDIKGIFGEGKQRFNLSLKGRSENQIKGAINDVVRFLQSKTSTKTGIDKDLAQRAKTSNEKYGVNFSWQEWSNYWSWIDENPKLEYESSTKIAATVHIYKIEHSGRVVEEIKRTMKDITVTRSPGVVKTLELQMLQERHPKLWRDVQAEIAAEGE